jgi:glycosyltransferase involved in cell wall biosynthesis
MFLRKQRVDILHTHSSKAGILGRFAAALVRTPVVIHTVHGWGFHDYQPWPIRRLYILLERMAAPLTDSLFAVSHENIETGLAEGIGHRSQYRVVRSGIQLAAFRKPRRSRAQVRRALGISAGAPVAGTVGNFKAQKAPFDFIRAAAAVAARVPRARFVMVGDGELRGESEELAGKLGLGRKVVFTGWRRDIPDLLHAFDVFALSSLFEGLPRSVLQAHAAGLPVVATAAGGTPEAVKDGVTGYIVKRRDTRALAGRLIELLKDPAKARGMGAAGAKLIGEEFEIRRMLHDIETCYMEIAEKKRLT